jgi:hypothetical protein
MGRAGGGWKWREVLPSYPEAKSHSATRAARAQQVRNTKKNTYQAVPRRVGVKQCGLPHPPPSHHVHTHLGVAKLGNNAAQKQREFRHRHSIDQLHGLTKSTCER